jgi:pyridoxine 5-phosphate synthase
MTIIPPFAPCRAVFTPPCFQSKGRKKIPKSGRFGYGSRQMPSLGVNIDHVATVRQARYRETPDSFNCEPDPVEAALIAEKAGAHGITAHLRLDRRHIVDRDIWRLKDSVATKLNLEMGNTPEIVGIALQVQPRDVCLVPENRREVTTEGGLHCTVHFGALSETVGRLREAGIRVSLFIDPEDAQIDAAARLKADFIELHTGAFANADEAHREEELQRLIQGADFAHSLGLGVNAGHGINYHNIRDALRIPWVQEFNIGHSIISRAVFVGIEAAVREMRRLIDQGA